MTYNKIGLIKDMAYNKISVIKDMVINLTSKQCIKKYIKVLLFYSQFKAPTNKQIKNPLRKMSATKLHLDK